MKPTPAGRRLLRLLWICACALVTWGSLLPGSSSAIRTLEMLHVPDKLLHLGAYTLLALLPALHESRRALTLSVAAALLLGVALEAAQRAVRGRSFEVADLAANAAGLLAGLVLGLRWRSG